MKYQDTWINGKAVSFGKRECSSRYQIIRTFCNCLERPFTVCDIGANMAYFGLRLIEDFGCNVVAFEFHQFEEREKVIKANKTSNLLYLKRKLSLADLAIMNSCCHFDLVLAMSVLHHVTGSVKEWITALKALGRYVIIEFALDDSSRIATRKEYEIPDGELLGFGDSHLEKGSLRPIILLGGQDGIREKEPCLQGDCSSH